MNLTLLTANSPEFQPLADLTFPNKMEYAERWDCQCYEYKITENIAWARPKIWLETLKTLKENDCLWWLGCDTLITNMTKNWREIIIPPSLQAEPPIPQRFNFKMSDLIITHDILGLNNDSFFIRHTPQAVRYLEWVIRMEGRQRDDQEAMAALIRNHFIDASIRPQREFNSYLEDLYKHFPHMQAAHARNPKHDGTWREGDFVIHFPAMKMEGRLMLVKEFLPKVMR